MASDNPDILLANVTNVDNIDDGVFVMIRVPENHLRRDGDDYIVDGKYITTIIKNKLENSNLRSNTHPVTISPNEEQLASSSHISGLNQDESIQASNGSSSDDEVDFEGITYRKFINVLRRWKNSNELSFDEIRAYLLTKEISVSKRSIKRLMYRALIKKSIIGCGERRFRKYKIIGTDKK